MEEHVNVRPSSRHELEAYPIRLTTDCALREAWLYVTILCCCWGVLGDVVVVVESKERRKGPSISPLGDRV